MNAESSRVITRLYFPGDGPRLERMIERVTKLSDDDVQHLLGKLWRETSNTLRYIRPKSALYHWNDDFFSARTSPLSIQSSQPLFLTRRSCHTRIRKASAKDLSDLS
jgi:hypothetical protein